MRPWIKIVGLLLLLLAAQQGALVHELGHLTGAKSAEVQSGPGNTEAPCSLCSSYAQASSPAVSYAPKTPVLAHAAAERTFHRQNSTLDAAAPRARSRGPPRFL